MKNVTYSHGNTDIPNSECNPKSVSGETHFSLTRSQPRIVYLPGVWDLLHVGHLNVIRRASLFGEYLIVGVCSDEIVKNTKGKYPAVNQQDRSSLLSGIKYIDEVYVYDNVDQTEQLEMLSPSVFAIGEDFGKQGMPQHQKALDFCLHNEILIKRIPRLRGISTSKIKSTIK
jgi:cytidyltransferase-like protein